MPRWLATDGCFAIIAARVGSTPLLDNHRFGTLCSALP